MWWSCTIGGTGSSLNTPDTQNKTAVGSGSALLNITGLQWALFFSFHTLSQQHPSPFASMTEDSSWIIAVAEWMGIYYSVVGYSRLYCSKISTFIWFLIFRFGFLSWCCSWDLAVSACLSLSTNFMCVIQVQPKVKLSKTNSKTKN